MKNKNNFLSKGILFLLLSFLLGCSSTVKKKVEPLAILSQYPTLDSNIIDTQTLIKLSEFPKQNFSKDNDLNSIKDKDEDIRISIKYIKFNFSKLSYDSNQTEENIIKDELEKTSSFLAAYFNYLNDYLSNKNVTIQQNKIQLAWDKVAAYKTFPIFGTESIQTPNNIIVINFLQRAIPSILVSKIENNIKENKDNIFKILFYRGFLVEKLDSKDKKKNYRKELNNIFMHNVGLIYLWCYANDIEISHLKKEYSENKEDMDKLFQKHLEYLTIKPLNEFPIIHEKN